jgi:hypothetical protein
LAEIVLVAYQRLSGSGLYAAAIYTVLVDVLAHKRESLLRPFSAIDGVFLALHSFHLQELLLDSQTPPEHRKDR